MFINSLLLLIAVFTGLTLLREKINGSGLWRATITPLASIIGSGFLIAAPLLHTVVNGWAPLAITGIVLLAYCIGSVIRFNIRYMEPALARGETTRLLDMLSRLSELALALAYVISVAFYLRLLASFLLRAVEIDHNLYANLITTAILGIIGITGMFHGLRALENLEKYAVHIKLSIIAALLFGLGWFDIGWASSHEANLAFTPIDDWGHTLRTLAGILLIVQGFETSRYMGDEYSAADRIRTMRYAQWLSGAIYILFVTLALPMLGGFSAEPNETAIIGLSTNIAEILPAMLIVAAVMSQFSAAVADTIGSGGLLYESSQQRIQPRFGYALVSIAAIALVWSANIFEIIALASRAFAFYYLLQTLIAIVISPPDCKVRWLLRLGHLCIAIMLALIVVFAIPAG